MKVSFFLVNHNNMQTRWPQRPPISEERQQEANFSFDADWRPSIIDHHRDISLAFMYDLGLSGVSCVCLACFLVQLASIYSKHKQQGRNSPEIDRVLMIV